MNLPANLLRIPARQAPAVARMHGFIRMQNAEISTVNAPGAEQTMLWGINDVGEILGTAYAPDGSLSAFIASESRGK